MPTATVVEVIEPEEEPIPAVTDRDAGTQTSPMSLSRSSSFLWVSDCNCSGSLDGSALLLPAGTGGATSPGDNPASSGVSRIVHMDTSATSSLVSLNSNSGGNRRRYKRMCTPDSAADAEDDEGNNPSLMHYVRKGVFFLYQKGRQLLHIIAESNLFFFFAEEIFSFVCMWSFYVNMNPEKRNLTRRIVPSFFSFIQMKEVASHWLDPLEEVEQNRE